MKKVNDVKKRIKNENENKVRLMMMEKNSWENARKKEKKLCLITLMI